MEACLAAIAHHSYKLRCTRFCHKNFLQCKLSILNVGSWIVSQRCLHPTIERRRLPTSSGVITVVRVGYNLVAQRRVHSFDQRLAFMPVSAKLAKHITAGSCNCPRSCHSRRPVLPRWHSITELMPALIAHFSSTISRFGSVTKSSRCTTCAVASILLAKSRIQWPFGAT